MCTIRKAVHTGVRVYVKTDVKSREFMMEIETVHTFYYLMSMHGTSDLYDRVLWLDLNPYFLLYTTCAQRTGQG